MIEFMEKIIHAMMNLIASEVCGKAIDPSQDPFSDEELAALYKLSKAHDLAHLVGDALIKNKLISNAEIKSKFFGGFCDDEQTKATIKALFDTDNYLCDTHTAVAVNVYEQYVEQTGDTTPSVIASTASPYKFSKAVLEAVSDGTNLPENEFDMVEKLFEVSNAPVPAPLAALKDKKARFSDVTEVNSMPQYVLDALNIKE